MPLNSLRKLPFKNVKLWEWGDSMSKPMKPVSISTRKISKEDKIRRAAAERMVSVGVDEITSPPEELISEEAEKEWNRVVPQLIDIDIIGNLDRAALIGYCNSYSNYMKATRQLSKQPLIKKETGKRNQLVDVQKNYADEMRRFASLCGISMDSRIKAGMKMQEKKEESLKDRFGAI